MPAPFSAQDVYDAYARIRDLIYCTPLEESICLGGSGRRYFFKLECAQTVKSFKIRGALSKMTTLGPEQRRRGVATVSSGNHGAAVSCAAGLLGSPNAVIIVPEATPQAKVDRIRFYGGSVLLMGRDYNEAHALGSAYIAAHGLTYIDPYYDDPKIYGGQGTISLEILRQNPGIDTIVCPIGGGGLITGIAVAAKALSPDIRIIGVQTEVCPAMIAALRDHVLYEEYPVTGPSVCDALTGGVGALSFSMLGDLATDVLAVKETSVREAVRHMVLTEKTVVEGGGAAALAAVLEQPERVGGKNVALVMSGGNIDGALLQEILAAAPSAAENRKRD